MNNQQMQQLHDRSTRGEQLSPAEQAQLDAWYALQDEIESQQVKLPLATDETVSKLQSQIAAALAQMNTFLQRLQVITAENERIKMENSTLRRQLVIQPSIRSSAI